MSRWRLLTLTCAHRRTTQHPTTFVLVGRAQPNHPPVLHYVPALASSRAVDRMHVRGRLWWRQFDHWPDSNHGRDHRPNQDSGRRRQTLDDNTAGRVCLQLHDSQQSESGGESAVD